MGVKHFKRKFTAQARFLLQHLPPDIKPHLRHLTDKILTDPYSGKALHKELKGHYSFKHQRYRVIYRIDESRRWVIIEYVGFRESVYEVFHQLLRSGKT